MPASPAALTSAGARSLWPATPAGRFGLSASLVVVAYVALPAHPAAEILSVAVISASSLAVLAGIATYEPERRSSWRFVALAVAIHALAAAVHGWELASGDGVGRSEAIALLAYPPMLIGLWGVSARRLPEGFGDRRWAIATTTVCALVWLLVVHPTLADGSLPLRAADRVGVHALLDGVAAAVVGRRLVASGDRNPSLLLATGALVLWGDAHGIVGSQVYDGTFVAASLAAGALLIGPVLLGMAALVPDMARTAPTSGDARAWYRRGVRELVVVSVVTVAVTATVLVAVTGTASSLLAAALLIAAIGAIGAGATAEPGRAVRSDLAAPAPASLAATTVLPPAASAVPLPPAPVSRPAVERPATRPPGPSVDRAPRPDQLELLHLPYVDLSTGEVLGVEALVRWRHPTRGLLVPAEFFGTSERSEVLRVVDDWSVTHALTTAASWRTPALIGINVGPARLAERAWVDHLLETAESFGVTPDRIVIETTERSFLDEQSPAWAHAGRLREAGLHVAIDDFGRDVGSLRTLVSAPVDVVKIRAGALRRSGAELDVTALQAARATGHRTAVVGVDEPALLRRAQELGVEIGQGFALSRPLPQDVVARRFDPGPTSTTRRRAR